MGVSDVNWKLWWCQCNWLLLSGNTNPSIVSDQLSDTICHTALVSMLSSPSGIGRNGDFAERLLPAETSEISTSTSPNNRNFRNI